MTHDDETVERVARALAADASTTEMGAAGFNAIHRKEYVEICWRDHEDRARAALSALPPRDELLREALSALEPFAAQTRASGPTEEKNIRRARAAAQRLRDALTQENQP